MLENDFRCWAASQVISHGQRVLNIHEAISGERVRLLTEVLRGFDS